MAIHQWTMHTGIFLLIPFLLKRILIKPVGCIICLFFKTMAKKNCLWFISIFLPLYLTACASYHSSTRSARYSFNKGEFSVAAEEYNKHISRTKNDELLALLDTAISYHHASQYQKSIHYFLQADKLVKQLDYLSISRQTASLLATDYVLKYKGEDFEKVLINAYLAMDYLMLGDLENALVEAKRVNQKLQDYGRQCKCDYKLNSFAIYLSGIIYELNGQYDEAYIDYKKVYKLLPEFPLLGLDLQRTSRLAGIEEQKLNGQDTFDKSKKYIFKKDYGELIVLFESGLSPEKHEESRAIAIPAYHKRLTRISYAGVYIDAEYYDRTYILNDIETTAIKHLNEKMLRILAKQGAVTAGKFAIANALAKETDNPLIGQLGLLFFYATNKADTRSWLSLPQNIQLTRFPLAPGKHQVTLKLYDKYDRLVESINFDNVTIEAYKKHFINYRSVK